MTSTRMRMLPMVLLFAMGTNAMAQRGGGRGGGQGGAAVSNFVVRGAVVLADNVLPNRIVRLERICAGRTTALTYADAKGQYSFNLGAIVTDASLESNGAGAERFKVCSIRASLDGFRAEPISLAEAIQKRNNNLPKIVLEPMGKNANASLSATDGDVAKNARKDFARGLDLTAAMKWQDAIAAMKKAAEEDPKFASAWLSLGVLQMTEKDSEGALKSYARAIAADDKFAAPYLEMAVAETDGSKWSEVIEHTGKVISLDPDAFPAAYFLSTLANIRTGKTDAAMKSATEGLRVDRDHLFPDLAYMQGIVLVSRRDGAGARAQFDNYLALAPNGNNAENARAQLKAISAAK